MSNWIQKAIKHPGALHKDLGVPEGQNIPSKSLHKAAKGTGTTARRARLAMYLKKLHKHMGGKDDEETNESEAERKKEEKEGEE